MSTDKQSSDSPADQIARCREFAARRGLEVVEALVMVDAGISGASRHDRPGLLSIKERIAEWDVLLCFDSSRLARDEEDFGWILNTLEEHGRTGFEASTGSELSSFGTRIMGVVNAEERRKIKINTHRGMLGRVERGMAPGAVPFGYRTRRVGEGQGAQIVVEPGEAEVVRRIFGLYAAGDGTKAIAKLLNAEGVPSPRPRALKHRPASWSPSAIREMLRHELYRRELFWNRSRWVKRRMGGRRRVERPESEWKRAQDEAWRIVDDELWAAVHERIAARRAAMRPSDQSRTGLVASSAGHRAPARHLLAGFLACEECGGAVCALRGGSVFGCSWHRDRGPNVCRNGIAIRGAELEAHVLRAIEDQVLRPDVVAYVLERAVALVRARRDSAGLPQRRARLAEVTKEISRLVALAARVDGLEELAEQLVALKAEREYLTAALRSADAEIDVDAEDESSASPDVEVLNALRPSLATLPGSMLIALSSPYARRGALFGAWQKHWAQDGDPVLFVQAPTRALNPSLDESIIAAAVESDESAARSEWLAEFRADLEQLFDLDALRACVRSGHPELPPAADRSYRAFFDASGGRHDAAALAIGHLEGERGVVDVLRRWPAPHSPEGVIAEAVGVLRQYGVRQVVGDRYAGLWPQEAVARHGLDYELSEQVKSELYLSMLGFVNSGRIELPDDRVLLRELRDLERRRGRSGKDSVDHPRGLSDDAANVVAGVASLLLAKKRRLTWSDLYPSPRADVAGA